MWEPELQSLLILTFPLCYLKICKVVWELVTTTENINAEKTPIVNSATQITNNVPNKPVNEIDNTPKVSTPTQSSINNANVTSINEVKPTNITPNVTSSVQSNTVNVTENKTPETKPNIIVNNNPKDILMPTIEDNKPIINANSELKNETVKTNNE